MKVIKDRLVIPLWDENRKLHSLQYISPDGEKRFLTGGRVSGCYFSIGSIQGAQALCVVEGFSTGVTIYEATQLPVAIAFNAGNLLAVSKLMRLKFPNLMLILCADDDFRVEGNPGLRQANEAAEAINGLLAIPQFNAPRSDKDTDFNDMSILYGSESVNALILKVIESFNCAKPIENESQSNGLNSWQEPLPITTNLPAEPYPIDALPDKIKQAVIEVQGFTRAPIALVAASAITTLSLAGQTYVDIKRAEKLTGPTGLFLITIADSGERKSTCDSFFMQAINEYEKNKADAAKPLIMDYNARLAAWQSKFDGVKLEIKKLAGKGGDTLAEEQQLLFIEANKPKVPRFPRLIYSDTTSEALKRNWGMVWPSVGIISSEGGIVLGAHSMKKDAAMRNLATYNQAWDGKSTPTDRVTSESLSQEVRLTMGIMVQETTIREFVSQLGGLARGTGFFARVLFSWPESTQGSRFYTDPPNNWPFLDRFNYRISEILNEVPNVDEDGILTPKLRVLAELAKLAWIRVHDAIEAELCRSGELYDIRDMASKAPDNIARLACLFHLMEHGLDGEVGVEYVNRASMIILWHLGEAQRFFGELALPVELANAMVLENWLIDHYQKENSQQISLSKVQQFGPNRFRGKIALLRAALQELEQRNRVKLHTTQTPNCIEINPALLNKMGET